MRKTRTNRRSLIVDVAAELFAKHGYISTSIQQISEEVGCTKASIYYHFKDGKRGLLQAVVATHTPQIELALAECTGADSIERLLLCITNHVSKSEVFHQIRRFRWIFAEYPRLGKSERDVIHNKEIEAHKQLTSIIRDFEPDEQKASNIAWMILCMIFGYGQLFINLGMQEISEFDLQTMSKTFSEMFSE